MKMSTVMVGVFCLFAAFSNAQKKNDIVRPTEIPVTYHGVTEPLGTFVAPKNTVNEVTKTYKPGYHPKQDWLLNETVNPNALPKGEDPGLQKHYAPANTTKALTSSWDGIGNFNVSPADPTVDVGPNHVVHMTNGSSGAYIQVYNKTGTPMGGQVYFDNFMSMPGGLGDPIVVYDQRADRWLLSEFSQNGNNMHVAISTTPDPLGTYYKYTFNAPTFPDYPKYSVWEDAYIITTNESSSRVYALNRADLLAGTPSTAQSFSMSNFGTIGFQAATPVNMDGTVVPPANTPPMVMRMRDDAWTGSTSDALEIWNVNIDWANAGNSSLTQNIVLNMALPFDSELCGYTSFSCINQPGSNTNLDPLREVLMNRIHYRNFGTHESIVCCHVTDVTGSDDAGIRWYELRRTGGSAGAWTIYQESTYSPDNASRWMPSIGISASGNIGLAYNITWDQGNGNAGNIYPSLAYTGRKECDPIGVMTEPETYIATGTTNNGSNRYGDYNAMGLDPSDGETFYFTGVYNPTTAGRTRIGAFSIDLCAQYPEVAFQSDSYTVDEASITTANGCLDYFTIDVPVSIGVAPTQNADITVTVAGGTATLGEDFILSNPTFTLAGSTLTGTAQITVYNDDYVEGTETIQLAYTLNANGGDAYAGAMFQTVTITINDDDIDPASATQSQVILTQDFESGLAPFTTVNPSLDTPWQTGNAAAASSSAFTVPNSNTTTVAYVNDDACDCLQDTVDLNFPAVDLTNAIGGSLSFDKYFLGNTYQGNIETAEILVSLNGGPYTTVTSFLTGGSWSNQTVDLAPYIGNASVALKMRYSDGSGWLYGIAVDNIQIEMLLPIDVQTDVNTGASQTSDLGPNGTVHFYDPTSGKVMATVENTSSFDYGCVTLEVDRQGTTPGSAEFNSTNTSQYLHSKTFKVTPTNANPTGTYNITLYYQEAEVAAWENATGNSRTNAEIVKVDGNNQISDVTPANAGTFTISNVPATLGAFNGDVTFTAGFTTGFSGFGVGILNAGANVPTANFTASETTICAGAAIDFTDMSSATPTSWSWNFGDGNTSTQQNPTNVYSTPGTYTVVLTATNANGSDVITMTDYITITAGVTSSQTVQLCPGESVMVGSSTYNSAGVYTDNLTTSIGCDSTVTTTVEMLQASTFNQSVSICQGGSYTVGSSTYTTAGTFTDVLQNASGCDSTVTTTLTVDPLPIVDVAPNAVEPLCVQNGGAVTLVGSPAGGNFSGPGINGSVFDPVAAGIGTHTITYSYTDANGCVGTVQLVIEVVDCASIDENALEGIVLMPNPSDGTFAIKGMTTGTEWNIYDARGRMIIGGKVLPESGIEKVSMDYVESGVYYLKANVNGTIGSMRFVIAK